MVVVGAFRLSAPDPESGEFGFGRVEFESMLTAPLDDVYTDRPPRLPPTVQFCLPARRK